MKIAVSGLGRMGGQIARKLAEGGHAVAAHNRSRGPVDEAAAYGAQAAYEHEDVVKAFAGGETLVLWMMIPADAVDNELDRWLGMVPRAVS
jgi:6-phosphogluconate dehydrogenase